MSLHFLEARGLGLSIFIAISIWPNIRAFTIVLWTINSVLSLPVRRTSRPWLWAWNLDLISVLHPSDMNTWRQGLSPDLEMICLHCEEVISSMIVQERCIAVSWSWIMSTAVDADSCIRLWMSAVSILGSKSAEAKATEKHSKYAEIKPLNTKLVQLRATHIHQEKYLKNMFKQWVDKTLICITENNLSWDTRCVQE